MNTRIRNLQRLLEIAKDEGSIACPFTSQTILCFEDGCGDCEIRQVWERQNPDQIFVEFGNDKRYKV